MKTIGKIAALAMTLSLAFVLTACGGSASSSAAASSAASSSTASSSAATSSSAAASSASAASSSSTENATVYTNEAFGIEYVLPDGWTFADASMLKQLNSPLSTTASADAVDMLAVSPTGSPTVMVAIIKPSSETSGKTAEDLLKAQVEEMQKGLEGSSYSYTSKEAEVTFNGLTRTLPANFTTITIEGTSIVMGQAVAEKDGYFMEIVVAGSTEDEVVNAFTNFKAVSE